MKSDLSVSIVVYKTNENVLFRCMNSILNSKLKIHLDVIDNSPSDRLRDICKQVNANYVFNRRNRGYGAGHNIAMQRTILEDVKYHLILNPDIYFQDDVLNCLCDFMDNHPDIGLVMPKILYPDGSIQYLCKLLPAPIDLIRRRFLARKCFSKKDRLYELRFADYNRTMDVPYLSGCFMFIRTEVVSRVGLFDERFFMYLEDVDLSRRMHVHSRTVYYPEVSVYHEYEKGSYKNRKLLRYHIVSAFKYFNKWGCFYDPERKKVNQKCLKELCGEK